MTLPRGGCPHISVIETSKSGLCRIAADQPREGSTGIRPRPCENALIAGGDRLRCGNATAAGRHMKRFIEGEDRSQVTLLPECLDDYIAEDNPVRVVEAFVEELDLHGLGFDGVEPLSLIHI